MAHRAAAAQQPATAPSAASPAIAFTGTTVVDVRTGRLVPNQVIVVLGSRIRAIGPAGKLAIPAGARVIRATGTYAIPGLWDMHVHTRSAAADYPLYIANGVTGVRDMGSPSLDSLRRWRREVLAGTRVGPRSIVAGPLIEGTTPGSERSPIPRVAWVATAAEGRRVVDSLQQAGADFIKVHDGLSREVYFAIAAEARRVGLPFAGHLPVDVTAAEASDSGQRSIEHALICRGAFATGTKTPMETIDRPWAWIKGTADLRDCPALAARFVKNDTWFSIGNPMDAGNPLVTNWPELSRYVPDSVLFSDTASSARQRDSLRYSRQIASISHEGRSIEAWAAAHADTAAATSPGQVTSRFYGKLERLGLPMLAGTDYMPWMTTVPSFPLHNLLWSLVTKGLTPLEALQTATLNPAKFLHATDSLGTLVAGKLADFVLLDANPLQDIYNTRRIRAVVANGHFFDRGDLDKLLLETEWLGRRTPTTP